MNKWSKPFLADLAERVGVTAIYGVIAMLTADSTGALSGDADQWWLIVGLPAALSLLKGLLANLSSPDSGASLLPPPTGPEVAPEPEPGDWD